MKIFVTGGSGFVGAAVIEELLRNDHQVVALARSADSAAQIEAAGAQALPGDLEDLDSLRRGAEQSDGVIHCGFIHDFAKYKENCEIDRRAIRALGAALGNKNRPLVVTSGLGLDVSGRAATEDDQPPPSNVSPRAASEEAARAVAAENRIPVAVVRLAPSVHGTGDHGFMRILLDIAKEKNASAYVGAGDNRWCAVHRFDAARLFRLAFEKSAQGADGDRKMRFYHGVAEPEIQFCRIAEMLGKRLGVPVNSLPPEGAERHFAWFARFAQIELSASSAKTQTELGWQPNEIGLLADVERADYFGD